MNQPTALFLADILEDAGKPADIAEKCAAELRRLYDENKVLHQRHHDDNVEYMRVLAQRDQLLKALNAMLTHMGMDEDDWNKPTFDQARAAIKKAEENT